MENTQKIYDIINELAAKLMADGSSMTRADLAYELGELDSPEISRYVHEALAKSGNEKMAACFVNNSKTDTLANEYQVTDFLAKGDHDSVFEVINRKLKDTDSTLGQLSQLVDEKTKIKLVQAASTLMGVVSGTDGIQKIQSEASAIFMKYKDMADSYKNAKEGIRSVAGDFSELRTSVLGMYRNYATMLVDIFGDSIKATMPEMFDFGKVEYLDVDSMIANVQLSYNSVYGKCGQLAGEVRENFTKSLKQGATQFAAQKDKRVGLVLAGINLISHYMKTGQQAQDLNHELAELKSSITHDVASIRADQVRLAEIYKTMHDVMVPKAEVFAKAAPAVFSDEIKKLSDSLYSSPEVQKLKEQRAGAIAKIRDLERKIADAEMSVNYYSGHISDCKDTMESLDRQYSEAKKNKPEPPSAMGNIISLGSAKKNYNRDIYEWSKNCEPLVKTFEDLAVDVKVDEEELQAQKAQLLLLKTEYQAALGGLDQINKAIGQMLKASPEVKEKAARHLDDIIKLLQLAKDIAASKLDSRLVGTVQVKKFHDIELPENVKAAVDNFKKDLAKDLAFTESDARDIAGKKISDEQAKQIADKGAQIMQNGVALCENMAQLSAMRLNHALAQEYYDLVFNKIKAQFAENMKGIDNQAQAIVEIARKVNASERPEEMKAALMLLLGGGQAQVSAQDFDDILQGKKIITI